MTPAQTTAFAAASGQAPNAILLTVAGIVITFAMVWLAYLSFQMFHAWRAGSAEMADIPWYVIRGAVVISVLIYFVN